MIRKNRGVRKTPNSERVVIKERQPFDRIWGQNIFLKLAGVGHCSTWQYYTSPFFVFRNQVSLCQIFATRYKLILRT